MKHGDFIISRQWKIPRFLIHVYTSRHCLQECILLISTSNKVFMRNIKLF